MKRTSVKKLDRAHNYLFFPKIALSALALALKPN